MASLHILKGPNQGSRLPLAKTVTILGREAKDCDIVIANQAVSRVHAQICNVQGQYFLEDLKSRNKTYLNNQLVEGRSPLKDNDRIKICDSMFTFHTGGENLPPLPAEFQRTLGGTFEEEDLPSTVQATLSRLPQQQILEAQPAERLRLLLDISTFLAQATDQEKLMDRIAESLFQVFRQADRCFIIFNESEHLVVRAFRSRRPSDEAPRFSRTIVRRCLEKMEAFLLEDAATDGKFNMAQSITDFRIRSVMIAPLGTQDGKGFGVIQLDTQDRSKRFTQDDLRLLTSVANQASAAIENARLQQEQVRQARIRSDLSVAEQIQRSFLPQKLPVVPGYEFFAFYHAALTIGGDYYDFIHLPDGRWAVLVGDVSGKGIPAALLMAKLSAEARFHMMTDPDPCSAVAKINDFMIRANLPGRFVTLAVALFDPVNHTVGLINAGHVPPMVYRAADDSLVEGVTSENSGFPLGIDEEGVYPLSEVTLGQGDALLIFTDGVTESLSRDGVQFEMDGVKKAMAVDTVAGRSPPSPSRLGTMVVEAVQAHSVGREQFDDIALVAIGRFDGIPESSGPMSKIDARPDETG